MKTHEEQIEGLENLNRIAYQGLEFSAHNKCDDLIKIDLEAIKEVKREAKELKEEIENDIHYGDSCNCDDCSKIRENIEKLNKIIGSEDRKRYKNFKRRFDYFVKRRKEKLNKIIGSEE